MKKEIDGLFNDYVNDLRSLIEIPSVLPADDNYPNVEPIQQSLKKMIEICDRIGFATYIDPDCYYGYAEVGEGEMFGILGHLDVVPAGDLEAWETNPFELVESDGKLIGRGVQDDKGPTLAALYALKMLLDSGFKLSKKVRFIFGTDEETAWRGIAKYQEKEEMPTMGFSPDSSFPLIYAEKGLMQLKLRTKSSGIVFKGGDAFNSVPSKVKYELDTASQFKENLDKLGFEYSEDLEVLGKSVHAQICDQGVNAIVRTFLAMKDIYPDNNAIKFVCETFGEDANGTPIFGEVADEHSGKLMFNLGMFDFNEEYDELCIDMRIPVTHDKEELIAKLIEVAKQYDLEYIEHDWLGPIYVPTDSELIVNLMAAYQEVTGDMESKPKTSGGATYSRAMSNCVAYGPILPTSVKTEHQPNEYVKVSDMKAAMEIYAKALQKLT